MKKIIFCFMAAAFVTLPVASDANAQYRRNYFVDDCVYSTPVCARVVSSGGARYDLSGLKNAPAAGKRISGMYFFSDKPSLCGDKVMSIYYYPNKKMEACLFPFRPF